MNSTVNRDFIIRRADKTGWTVTLSQGLFLIMEKGNESLAIMFTRNGAVNYAKRENGSGVVIAYEGANKAARIMHEMGECISCENDRAEKGN